MLKVDFNSKGSNKEGWYDILDDWTLVETSLAKQYGIRIRHNTDMQWTEFCGLISGLMADTPLGQIVSIRSETDPATIKQFNSSQKKIYNDWRLRLMQNKLDDPESLERQAKDLEKLFGALFS